MYSEKTIMLAQGDSLVESLVLHSTLPQVLTCFRRWCKVGQDDILILSEGRKKQIRTNFGVKRWMDIVADVTHFSGYCSRCDSIF